MRPHTMAGGVRVAAILVFCFGVCYETDGASCDANDVAVYRVVLKTLWSEEIFPKDYPQNRPKAQWSPLFGQSHNASYTLYRVGEVASEVVRDFSQFGKLDTLVAKGDENPMVYDQFSATAIGTGVGETGNMVFLNSDHHLVSIICRMIPSPDWIVGIDGLDLCVDSSWIEQVTLDLEPLDAGAARGLTFTAPRWENSPPEPVSRHGPRVPNHPAAGFYYPELRKLPAIAQVEVTKIKEYSIQEMNKLAHKGLFRNKQKTNEDRDEKDFQDEITTKNYIEELKDLEEEPFGTPKPNIPENTVIVVTQPPTTTSTTEGEFGNDLNNLDDVVLAVAKGHRLGLGKHLPRHFRSRLHHAVNKITSDDCLVTEWSEWSPCSVTCGFGDKFRTRTVIREATSKGRACPSLTDRWHCGDVNSCFDDEPFQW